MTPTSSRPPTPEFSQGKIRAWSLDKPAAQRYFASLVVGRKHWVVAAMSALVLQATILVGRTGRPVKAFCFGGSSIGIVAFFLDKKTLSPETLWPYLHEVAPAIALATDVEQLYEQDIIALVTQDRQLEARMLMLIMKQFSHGLTEAEAVDLVRATAQYLLEELGTA